MELSRAVLGNVTAVAAMGRYSDEHLVLASSAVLMLVLLAVSASSAMLVLPVAALTVNLRCSDGGASSSEGDGGRSCLGVFE